MSEFARLTETAFDAYHNVAPRPNRWSDDEAAAQTLTYLGAGGRLEYVPGLHAAFVAMLPHEWDRMRAVHPQKSEIINQVEAEVIE